MRRFAAIALVAALSPAALFAGKIKTVTVSSPAQYEKAAFQQAVVSSEGTIRLARWLKPLAADGSFDAARVWDVVEDKAGNLFAATGDAGKIFKIAPDGAVSVAYESKDSQILCLLASPDGAIYAGTGPTGLIVRLDSTGSKVLSETKEAYVWALAYDESAKTLFAATGPHGRILKVNAEGKAESFFHCKQDHILSLARASDGTLYAGTDKQGLIYRIDARGKGFVLFQAAQAEVHCLQWTAGALYAGTSSPGGGRGGIRGASSERANSFSAISKDNPSKGAAADPDKKSLAVGGRERDKGSENASPASAPSSAGSGENSVYRIGLDGSAREVFRQRGLILSLLKTKDRLFVGTGSNGQLFEVNEATRERSEVARLDHGQVNRLYRRRDGSVVLAAGDPGKLYVLQDRFVGKGSVVSEVIDARLVSRWGSISWDAEVPQGTKLSVAVRAGNVAEPDETWSDWSAEQADPKSAVANVPSARYLQWRLSLTTDDIAASPALHNLSLHYATLNQAPEVTSLDVPNLNAINAKDPKKVKLKWQATDANEDELAFEVLVRKDGWKDWVKVEDGLSKSEFDWDTATMPSGIYRIKIVASDRPDNNESEALRGERISGPVAVAHEPPVVTLHTAGVDKGRVQFEAKAESPLVRLHSAMFAIDGGKWANIFPTDSLFDSKMESFRFASETLSAGTHVLVLKVRDAAGNVGSADVVFTVERGK